MFMGISKRKKHIELKDIYCYLTRSLDRDWSWVPLISPICHLLCSNVCVAMSPLLVQICLPQQQVSHLQTLVSTLEAKWEEAKRVFSSLAYSFNEEESCPTSLQLTFLKYQCHTFISISIVGVEEG